MPNILDTLGRFDISNPIHGPLGQLFGGLFGGGDDENTPRPGLDVPVNFSNNPFINFNPYTRNPGTPQFDPETGYFTGLGQPGGGVTQPRTVATKTERDTASLLRALIQNLPALGNLFNAQILPNERAQLAASQAVSPEYAQLQRDIFRGNALSEAGTTNEVLRGPGSETVFLADALSRLIDPEFFKTRENTSNAINDLLKPGLTGGEREEIQRSLNQANNAAGTLTIPTNISTVENATTFGRAARDRVSQAVNQATNFLPTSRTGVDVLQQATRQPSSISGAFGNARSGAGEQSSGNLGSLAGTAGGLAGQQINASTQRYLGRLQQPDTLDRISQVLGSVNY